MLSTWRAGDGAREMERARAARQLAREIVKDVAVICEDSQNLVTCAREARERAVRIRLAKKA